MPEQSGIQFHFLEPAWLLALLPLALLLWLAARRQAGDTAWRRIIDVRLQPLLMNGGSSDQSRLPLWLLGAGWLIAVLALANPVWERQPQPLIQTNAARIIVLDLSRSMLAQDLKPTRIERARFKVEDILAEDEEGLTGLVVFAGDAFTVTPLTRDTETIRAQLRALEPAIMPSQGSRADLGLLQALELLQQAGVAQGQIILIADGVEGDLATDAAEQITQAGHSVSVLGVGTPEGAPLYDARGNRLRHNKGQPLIVGLDTESLRRVALAGSGLYRQMTTANSDIDVLLVTGNSEADSESVEDMRTEKWKERGPYLTLLLLPLAALAFRRGWLFSFVFAVFLVPSQDAMAIEWRDLWQRADQQAAEALQQQEYDRVPDISNDPSLLGSAAYKRGDFSQALEQFDRLDGADAAYNRGNALARLGQYREAIQAYDEALEQQPEMEDAIFNKAAIEELLKQREQEEQQQSDEQQEPQEQGNRTQQSEQQQEQQPSSEQQERQNQQADSGQESEQQQGTPDQQEQQSQQAQDGQESEQQGKQDQAQQQGAEEDAQTAEQQATRTGEKPDENQFAKANEALDDNRKNDGSNNEEEFMGESSGDQPRQPETAQQQEMQPGNDDEAQQASAEELSSEEEMAAQQWLRRIPDDPGGLLRRKFLYQYRERGWRESPGGQGY